MTKKAVLFDMGGTLETYCFTDELRLNATPGIQTILSAAGIDPGLSNRQLFEVVNSGLTKYHEFSVKTQDEYPSQRVWSEFILPGYPIDYEKLAAISEDLMVYIETHYYHRVLRPEVPQVLAELRSMGFKIGMISNINSLTQVGESLRKYKIEQYFDPVVLSSEFHRRKPDPSIFHYAARLIDTPASECVFVGDQISRDIVGAQKAGYALAVQIKHDFITNENGNGFEPDAVISDMRELLPIVRTLQATPRRNGDNPIQALLFDAGDILYYRIDRGKEFLAFLEEHRIPWPADHDQEREKLTERAYRGEMDQDQFRDEYIKLFGITDPALIAQGKQLLDDDDNRVTFFEGVRETLLTLKKDGFLLGIVTDTANPISVKLSWFERAGIGRVWDSIISSKEIGTRKPDPKIYLAALRQLNLEPHQAVFVGHKKTEIDGARNVGMQTIAFNYENGVISDYYIKDFCDLLSTPVVKRGGSHG